MSNVSIIHRLQRMFDDYISGKVSPDEIARSIEASIRALESIKLEELHKADSLCAELIDSQYYADEGFEPNQPPPAMIEEFREFLNALPT